MAKPTSPHSEVVCSSTSNDEKWRLQNILWTTLHAMELLFPAHQMKLHLTEDDNFDWNLQILRNLIELLRLNNTS